MRKKPQSWFVPLLILVAVLWAIGKKDTTPAQIQPTTQSAPDKLASFSATPSSPIAPPADQYVSTDKLNIRDQPGGKIISKLQRGDKVQVFEKRNEWVRVSIDDQPARWLSSKNLCSGADCYVAPVPKSARAAPQPVRSPASEYGSSCPCSSGSICIGPRGGRYCITSGGKKRYGV